MSSVSKYSLSPSSAAPINECASDVPILFTIASSKCEINAQESNIRSVVDVTPSGMTHSLYNLQLQVPSAHQTKYYLRDTLTDAIVVDGVKDFLNADVDVNVHSSKSPMTVTLKQASIFRRLYKYTWEGRPYHWELNRKNQLTLSRQTAGSERKKYEIIGCAKLQPANPDQVHQVYTRFELNADAFQDVHDKLPFEHVTILTLCLLIDNIGPGFTTFPISPQQVLINLSV
ncbi:unnamed protein product [Umbelopsis vinacea]